MESNQTEPIQPEPIQPESTETVLGQHLRVLKDLIKNGEDYVERQERVTKGRKMQLECFKAHAKYVSYLEENPTICDNEPKFAKTQLAIISSVIQPAPPQQETAGSEPALQQETAVSEPALQQNQCGFCNRAYASSNNLQKHKKKCPLAQRK